MKRNARRAGRPADFEARARLVVFVEAEELAAVHARAQAEGVSTSTFARAAVLEALSEGKKKPMKGRYPLRFSERELAKFKVEIRDPRSTILGCAACGRAWSPMRRAGGRLPRGYWVCPDGCNAAGVRRAG